MSDDISDEELEIRMRAALFGGNERSLEPTISIEEKKIAAKLLGEDNAARLGRIQTGQRFIYRRPVMSVEYYSYPDPIVPRRVWRINVVENGKPKTFKDNLSYRQCMFVVGKVRERGLVVKELDVGAKPEIEISSQAPALLPKQAKPNRKDILNKLKGFSL